MFIGDILTNETNMWMCLHPNGTLMAECDDQLDWYPICIQPSWPGFGSNGLQPIQKTRYSLGIVIMMSSCIIMSHHPMQG